MEITEPLDGSTVSGITTIKVDAPGIKRVNFYIDGTLKGRDRLAPFTFSWYTDRYPDGYHEVKAVSSNGKHNAKATYIVQNKKPAKMVLALDQPITPKVGDIITVVVSCQ